MLPLARVPWLFRRRIGKLRAYWQTVREIVRRPNAFAKEVCRPVRLCVADARAFRKLSVRVAMATCIVTTLIALATVAAWNKVTPASLGSLWANRRLISTRDTLEFIGGLALIPWTVFLLSLMFRLGTDLPTFIWRGLEGSEITLAPLHHYASAPLALMPVSLLSAAGLVVVANLIGVQPPILAIIAGSILLFGTLLVPILLWLIPLRLMREATGCSRKRVLALALYLPVHWFLMLVITLLGFGVGCVVVDEIVKAIV